MENREKREHFEVWEVVNAWTQSVKSTCIFILVTCRFSALPPAVEPQYLAKWYWTHKHSHPRPEPAQHHITFHQLLPSWTSSHCTWLMTCHWDNGSLLKVSGDDWLLSVGSYLRVSGQMLSLEDGPSSSSGQEVEGTKREGPSEYEITLENKNKQVCPLYMCVGPQCTWSDGMLIPPPVQVWGGGVGAWWIIIWHCVLPDKKDFHSYLFPSLLTWAPVTPLPQGHEQKRCLVVMVTANNCSWRLEMPLFLIANCWRVGCCHFFCWSCFTFSIHFLNRTLNPVYPSSFPLSVRHY